MNRRTAFLMIAALVLAVLSGMPARATGNAASCQLVGTVDITNPGGPGTDLQNATFGHGNFDTLTSSLTCVGSTINGTAGIQGGDSFDFCVRGGTFSNPACKAPGGLGQKLDGLEAAYDGIQSAEHGLVAYFSGSGVSTTNFAVGGSCTFSFWGYAIAANANIHIQPFRCGGITMTGTATATSVPLATNPCGSSLCFNRVVFIGQIEVND